VTVIQTSVRTRTRWRTARPPHATCRVCPDDQASVRAASTSGGASLIHLGGSLRTVLATMARKGVHLDSPGVSERSRLASAGATTRATNYRLMT
jgi:hypothetical protein